MLTPVLVMARGCAQVIRLAVISSGRRMLRSLRRARLVAGAAASGQKLRLGVDVSVLNPGLIKSGSGVTVGDHAELLAEPSNGYSGISIQIGDNVKIGKRCQLAANPGFIHIGSHVSLHSNVVLIGQVRIGRYTLLSANIFASSGNHHAFDNPHLLIRDQDLVARKGAGEVKPVVIEEDCWIGWGVVIMSGVHIGRGAVVGSNAVVTKDVEPYDVVAGQPARRLKQRLSFSPRASIIAAQPECAPYLYRGFLQLEAERQMIATQWPGHVGALDHTVIVLSGAPGFSRLLLRGVTLVQAVSLHIQFEGGEYIMTLPEKAGSTFEEGMLLSEFRPAGTDLSEPDCRVPSSRTFRLTVRFPRMDAGHQTAAWAIHSVSLTH